MRMLKRACALIAAVLLMMSVPACAAPSFMRYTSDYFGTVSMLRLYDMSGAEETWAEVKELLAGVDRAVSVSDPASDIARFNCLRAGEGMEISELTADLFRSAQAAYELTGGLYDPTVYPLVDLWGFSPRFNTREYRPVLPYDRPLSNGRPVPPEESDIKALLPLMGLEGIELSHDGTGWVLTKHTPAVVIGGVTIEAQLDLGGIAKGYACDRVRELLTDRGYTEGYFICGDSSMTFLGGADGQPYQLTAGKPRATVQSATEYARFALENASLATSSDAAHAYDAEGVHWCHLIDPRTGWPINRPDAEGVQAGAASVTVIGEEAAMLDALGTALCVMGPEAAEEFIKKRPERMIMALWRSDSDEYAVLTDMEPGELELPDPAYRLAR